jgi:hypothetical protein
LGSDWVRARFLGEPEPLDECDGDTEKEESEEAPPKRWAGGNEALSVVEDDGDDDDDEGDDDDDEEDEGEGDEETKFLTLVCQTMGEERLVRRLRSSGPLRSEASGTAPSVLPVLPFRRCACSVFVYLSPHL